MKPDMRIRVLFGGRSSSKSWDAAGMAILMSQTAKIKFLCVRQFQNRIEDSVYTLLKNTIHRFGVTSNFTVLKNKITCNSTGSEFVFYGLWRHIDEIKSMENIGICWIEEAHLFTKDQWNILEPTLMRNNGYQFWIIFNPRFASDFVYKRFVTSPPPDTIVRKINYNDNPFLNSEALKVIATLKKEDINEYLHIYGGEPMEDDNESIIKRTYIMTAIDAHIKLKLTDIGTTKRIGFDVADGGQDSCATVATTGSLVTGIKLWKAKEDELLKSATKVYRDALEVNALIIYDAIGVGASCGAKFTELGYRGHTKFFAGGAVIRGDKYKDRYSRVRNKDFYENIKAQAWFLLAEKLKNTYNAVHNGHEFDINDMVFIDSKCRHLEQLVEELSAPKKSYSIAGKVMVEKKEAMLRRGVVSPNIADALVMATLDKILISKGRGLM